MKKLLYIYLFLLPALTFCQVLNGSFETDTSASLDNWRSTCFADSFADAPQDGGNWCLKLESGNFEGCFPGTASQVILGIKPGEIWKLTTFARTESRLTKAGIYLKVFHKNGPAIVLTADTTSAPEWTMLSVSDTLPGIAIDSVALVLDAGSTGGPGVNQAYFDLVTAEKIGEIVNSTGVIAGTFYPKNFILFQNFPNPFNPSTDISYQLAIPAFVTLKIYNIRGKEVRTLVKEFQNAGLYKIHFDALDLSAGIYLYQLRAGKNFSASRKMLLLK